MRKTVYCTLESLNKWKGSKFGYRNYKQRLDKVIGMQLNPVQKSVPSVKRKVTINYRHVSKRLMDADNLSGALKPVFDMLVEKKWLKDDAPEWCDREITQERITDRQEQGFELEISEVEC